MGHGDGVRMARAEIICSHIYFLFFYLGYCFTATAVQGNLALVDRIDDGVYYAPSHLRLVQHARVLEYSSAAGTQHKSTHQTYLHFVHVCAQLLHDTHKASWDKARPRRIPRQRLH